MVVLQTPPSFLWSPFGSGCKSWEPEARSVDRTGVIALMAVQREGGSGG